MRINLLGRKRARVASKDSEGDKSPLKKVSSRSFGDGLYTSRKPAIAEHAVSYIKAYIIVVISAISAFCVGYLFSIQSFVHGTVAILIFTTIFMIQTILLRKALDIALVVILDALGFSLFLVETSFSAAAYLLVILSAMFVLAHVSNRREIDNMVQLKFIRAVKSGTSLLLVALSVFIGLTLFVNGSIFFEKENVARAINVIGRPILSDKIENFSAEMEFDEFLRSYIRTELGQEKDFKKLPKSGQEAVINMQTDNLVIYIETRTGYKPQMDKSVAENIQELISTKTEALYPKSQSTRLALVIVILVITVKGIEFLLFPILALLGLMVYELLIGFGFVEIQFESRSKETLNLPSRRS